MIDILPIQTNIPRVFFQEEIRNDFLVTEKMKKVWAVQLDLLEELKRVCNKYGLTYYADSGTLIGAIRHKGYIPWDDDIDIVMKRQDYDMLTGIAPTEFKNQYFFQNAYSDYFIRGFSRLRNSMTTCITLNDVRLPCNKGIFIDIFPLDQIPEGVTKNSAWLKMLKLKFEFMRVGANSDPKYYSNIFKKGICFIGNQYFRIVDYKKSYKRFEQSFAKYNGTNSQKISYLEYSYAAEKHIWDIHCFDDTYDVPFEFTTICIPSGFDSRLKVEYGDYMIMKKAPTQHGFAILDPEVSYKDFEKMYGYNDIKNMINGKKEYFGVSK